MASNWQKAGLPFSWRVLLIDYLCDEQNNLLSSSDCFQSSIICFLAIQHMDGCVEKVKLTKQNGTAFLYAVLKEVCGTLNVEFDLQGVDISEMSDTVRLLQPLKYPFVDCPVGSIEMYRLMLLIMMTRYGSELSMQQIAHSAVAMYQKSANLRVTERCRAHRKWFIEVESTVLFASLSCFMHFPSACENRSLKGDRLICTNFSEVMASAQYDMLGKLESSEVDKIASVSVTSVLMARGIRVGSLFSIGSDGFIYNLMENQLVLKIFRYFDCAAHVREIQVHTILNTLNNFHVLRMYCGFSFMSRCFMITKKISTSLFHTIKTLSDEAVCDILFQAFYTLGYLQKSLRFTHYDLHSGNILLDVCPSMDIYYHVDDKCYKVPNHGFNVVLADFATARVEYNGYLYSHDNDRAPLSPLNTPEVTDREIWESAEKDIVERCSAYNPGYDVLSVASNNERLLSFCFDMLNYSVKPIFSRSFFGGFHEITPNSLIHSFYAKHRV